MPAPFPMGMDYWIPTFVAGDAEQLDLEVRGAKRGRSFQFLFRSSRAGPVNINTAFFKGVKKILFDLCGEAGKAKILVRKCTTGGVQVYET